MTLLSSLSRPWVIAHRGRAGAEENTIAAFEWAIDRGADLIEFDVRRSRDGVWVIHHDPDIQGYPLQDLTYTQIAELKPLPTLPETLQILRDRIGLDIEIKQPGHEPELVELLSRYCDLDQVIVTSFLPASLRRLRDGCPALKLGVLSGPQDPIPDMLKTFDLFLPHWQQILSSSPQAPNLDLEWIPLPIIPWTVNQISLIPPLMRAPQILGIITDQIEPVLALKQDHLGGR